MRGREYAPALWRDARSLGMHAGPSVGVRRFLAFPGAKAGLFLTRRKAWRCRLRYSA